MIAKVTRMHEFRRMVLKNKWQEQWLVACLGLVAVGLVFSRAVLSIATVLILIPFLFNVRAIKAQKPALTGVLLILLPVIISGLWSSDAVNWRDSLIVRLPLLALLLGCGVVTMTRTSWLLVAWTYLLVISAGCLWSLWQYALDPAAVQASYLKAKVLPTLADHDYVRSSWMVMIAILIAAKCRQISLLRTTRYWLTALIVFFIVYLHILATKTGLLCLYSCAIIYIVHLLAWKRNWQLGLGAIALALTLAWIAYQTLPTLRNRIQYVRYDFSLYSKTGSAPGYNDAARLVSLRAGVDITASHPLTGVGFGDMRSEINDWHSKNQPASLDYERFLPANEWLVYGTGSGWPGIICFTAGLLLLLYATTGRNLLSVLLAVTAIIPLLTDDTLEGQFGAVLLGFISFFGQQNQPVQHE